MKIHYFQVDVKGVATDVATLLKSIIQRPQNKREISIGGKDVFLESFSNVGGLYHSEFTQRRSVNGPGKSAPGNPTEDFDLDPGEGFGEQAAVIWSPSGHAAVQYNHHGVRPSGIRIYLNRFLQIVRPSGSAAEFVMDPVLDPDVVARLVRSKIHTRIELGIATTGITEEMAQSHVALDSALRIREETSAARVDIVVSRGRDRPGGPLGNVLSSVRSISEHAENLLKLKTTVKRDRDSASEVLDLLEHRETDVVEDRELDMSPGRRYTYESRIRAIRERFEDWLNRRDPLV